MDQNPVKKAKLDRQEDGTVTLFSDTDYLQSQANKPTSSKQHFYNGFIQIQGKDPVKIKLERPLLVGDSVVLLKDFPDNMLFKGYVCEVMSVENLSIDPSQSLYQVVFHSDFNKNDPSLNSKGNSSDFRFPTQSTNIFVSGDNIIRLEFQDLQYKTYFL